MSTTRHRLSIPDALTDRTVVAVESLFGPGRTVGEALHLGLEAGTVALEGLAKNVAAADALVRVLRAVDVLLMAGDSEKPPVLPQDQRKCADGLTPCRCADRALVGIVGGLDGKQEGGVNG